MRFYSIEPDDDAYPHDYNINACHKWSVPGVKCAVCGFTGSIVGLAYPDVTLPDNFDLTPYKTSWPVAPARIRELAEPLRRLLQGDFPVLAGTEFGRVAGKASGRFGDFTWLNPWTPFISPEAMNRLRDRGIDRIQCVPAEIQLRSKSRKFEHVELCLRPLVHAYEEAPPRECSECGTSLERGPETIEPYRPTIRAQSLPTGVHLARVIEAPAFIVATEEFACAVRELNLTDIKFEELPNE